MQLTTLLSAAAAAVAVSALPEVQINAIKLNQDFKASQPYARIINRCDYDVYVWSVVKGRIGCPTNASVKLKKGEIYNENYQDPGNNEGVSIKVGKDTDCTRGSIVQLEYFLEKNKEKYNANYLDVSYVDCYNNDCPTKQEGYYLEAGSSAARAARASADGSWCPVLSCSDPISCAKMSYILPDDVQTKSCALDASMDFYMCGSQPPSEDDNKPASSAPASSSEEPKPSPKPVEPTPVNVKVDTAAVTPAPEIKDAIKAPPKVKTEIVYVTAYEYVNAKRHEHAHAHAHARRHQQFHA